MSSGRTPRIWLVAILTPVFLLGAGRTASGISTRPPAIPRGTPPAALDDARARLTDGFHHILDFFAQRDFSLLAASRAMRASGDPDWFEHNYPAISKELDGWAESLSRFDVSEAAVGRLDFTFVLRDLASVALDGATPAVRRDNALVAVCTVCTLDSGADKSDDVLRCDADSFHRFLAAVVADDPSAPRKAEALRSWRDTGGFIDEGLVESALASPAGADLELRVEAARTLFAIDTRRSLRAQRRLAGTSGVEPDPDGVAARIACEAIHRFAGAGYQEAAPDLLAALKDPSPEVRACAADSLSRLTGRN